MLKVGITGINGFLGWHTRISLYSRGKMDIHGADRETFADPARLEQFATSCDVVIHCAGMNRGEDKEVAATNIGLTEMLILACARMNVKPHVVFPSSTHVYRNTPYGDSKKACAQMLQNWSKKTGAKFSNLIIPNIFGEGGKPFYNSAVATFCYQLANGLEPKIINDSEIELIHAQKVADEIIKVIESGFSGEKRLEGAFMHVGKLLTLIQGFADTYHKQIMPNLNSDLEVGLFNTFRSYLFPKHYPVKVPLHKDERGYLFEAIKSNNKGQCFIGTSKPGITRGDHYHLTKVERFFVIRGSATIRIRRLFSTETVNFEVKGELPCFIDIPTLHTHNITNTGKDELMTLFWSNVIFDQNNPDTFKETV